MEISVSIVFTDVHAFDGTPPPFSYYFHLVFCHSRHTQVELFFLLVHRSSLLDTILQCIKATELQRTMNMYQVNGCDVNALKSVVLLFLRRRKRPLPERTRSSDVK